jgi:uncharacterized membrane protein
LADPWTLTQSLALILLAFGFGIVVWARLRAREELPEATVALLPYAAAAVFAGLLTTLDECPARWRLLAFGAETLTLVIAGRLAGEPAFVWLAVVPMAAGALAYFGARPATLRPRNLAWTNLVAGLACLVAAERALKSNGAHRHLRACFVIVATGLGLFALRRMLPAAYLTFGWAVLGFALLAFGFAVKARAYRIAGLVALAFSLMRAVFYDLAKLETLQRILSFLGLGAILLVLAYLYARNRDKIAKWL